MTHSTDSGYDSIFIPIIDEPFQLMTTFFLQTVKINQILINISIMHSMNILHLSIATSSMW